MKQLAISLAALALMALPALGDGARWQGAWPNTDFSKSSVDIDEILSGGPPRDGIPPIDEPRFVPVEEEDQIAASEPVIGVTINGKSRAYPLRILMWHEIVNDELEGTPIAVTFCPLCNAAIVFDRRVDGRVFDFGTTGKLRRSDLVMWDRQTESWWQQFMGEAIVGEMTGARLALVPARLESYENFKQRTGPGAEVLVPNGKHRRRYGANPYSGYDSGIPFLYDGETPPGLEPLERVVSLEDKSEAWSLALLRQKGSITTANGTVLSWSAGQNSALDTDVIAEGKDVGNVIATRNGRDVVYFVDFAFAFHAFRPQAPIHKPE